MIDKLRENSVYSFIHLFIYLRMRQTKKQEWKWKWKSKYTKKSDDLEKGKDN